MKTNYSEYTPMKTNLVALLKILTSEDEWFPAMDRDSAIRSIRGTIRAQHLSIPSDSRLWDSSTWDYFHHGIWFHPTSDDMRLADKKARRHGFRCDPNAPYVDGWKQTYPRTDTAWLKIYQTRTAPKLP